MGLDMYAHAIPAEEAEAFATGETEKSYPSFHYWRKHHDLHGWMCRRWLAQNPGRTEVEFNLKPLQLTAADLDDLELAVEQEQMPHTTGFFFGNYPPDDRSRADDLEFIAEARKVLARGEVVFYNSWW